MFLTYKLIVFRLVFEPIFHVYLYSCILALYVDECLMYDRLVHVITNATSRGVAKEK
jgi:hypothetical protein